MGFEGAVVEVIFEIGRDEDGGKRFSRWQSLNPFLTQFNGNYIEQSAVVSSGVFR